MALFLCLEIGLVVILILPFFHVLFPDNFEVQLSKPTFGNQKMKSARICSSSEKSAWEGFAIFDHFNLHLYLHNALVWFITVNTDPSSCRHMVQSSRSLASALRSSALALPLTSCKPGASHFPSVDVSYMFSVNW